MGFHAEYGVTEEGIHCEVFVHRIAVNNAEDQSQFDRELRDMDPPGGPRTVPLSHIL